MNRFMPQLIKAESPTFNTMRDRAILAIKYRQVVTFIGEAGSGKSHFLQHVKDTYPSAVCVEVGEVDISAKRDGWLMIYRALGYDITPHRGRSSYAIHHEINEYFSSRNWAFDRHDQDVGTGDNFPAFLVIDEAQRILPNILRAIIDLNWSSNGPQIGLIIMGNHETLGAKKDRKALNQIISRLAPNTLEIKATWEDYSAIAIANEVEGYSAYQFIRSRFDREPDLRDLAFLLSKARMLVPVGTLTIGTLERAASQMGNRSVFQLARV